MGAIIVKASPDKDLYQRWSSVVDAPTWSGTRAQAAAEFADEFRRAGLDVEDALARCDETGTTSRIGRPAIGAWDDTGLVFMNHWGGPSGFLPRSSFPAFADRLHTWDGDGPGPEITDLLTDIDKD